MFTARRSECSPKKIIREDTRIGCSDETSREMISNSGFSLAIAPVLLRCLQAWFEMRWCQFQQGFSAQGFTFGRPVVGVDHRSAETASSPVLSSRLQVRSIELNNLLLLRVNTTCKNHEAELPGLQNEVHDRLGAKMEKLHISPGPMHVKDQSRRTRRF